MFETSMDKAIAKKTKAVKNIKKHSIFANEKCVEPL